MNVLSLFAGIGGLDLGLERAGMTVVGQVEIDPYCRAVLAKHWPEVPRHDDVRTCVEWWLGQPRPAVDVVAGGFPCQPVSSAGRQRAQEDERWLWPEMAAVIRNLRPRYAIMENVPGLLARGMGDILADLAACGYDAEWDCVPAAAVGAPHRRDRVFIVAHAEGDRWGQGRPGRPAGDGPDRAVVETARLVADTNRSPRGREAGPAEPGACLGAVRERPEEPRRRDSDVADATGTERGAAQSRGLAAAGWRTPESGERDCGTRSVSDWWRTEPDVGRVAHGVPRRVDRLRALGNAVVPQVAEHVGRLVMEAADVRP